MARSNHSKDEKLAVLRLLHKGQKTISELATIFQVSYKTIEEWNYKYEIDGEIGLEESTSWNPYSKELKLAACTRLFIWTIFFKRSYKKIQDF